MKPKIDAPPEEPAFPAPRARSAEEEAPRRESTPHPTAASSKGRIVHRPSAPSAVGETAPTAAKPKLTKDEMHALLDVMESARGGDDRRRVFKRVTIVGLPLSGVLFVAQMFLPEPVTWGLVAVSVGILAWQIRSVVVSARRW